VAVFFHEVVLLPYVCIDEYRHCSSFIYLLKCESGPRVHYGINPWLTNRYFASLWIIIVGTRSRKQNVKHQSYEQ